LSAKPLRKKTRFWGRNTAQLSIKLKLIDEGNTPYGLPEHSISPSWASGLEWGPLQSTESGVAIVGGNAESPAWSGIVSRSI